MMQARVVLVSSKDYSDSVDFHHKRLFELPFGIDSDRFSPGDSSKIRKRYGMSDDATVMIFVGGLDDAHYFKGVDVLLAACAGLQKDSDWHLLIVGAGNRIAEYQIQSQKLNIKNRVHFAGRVSSDDLSDYYRAANLHILPSIDRSEAFGLVTLEAAASGLSSIVSDLPGVRTLVEHKKSGIIVDPRDKNSLVLAITWALNNKEKLNEMGKFARTRVLENYSNSVCIERLRQAYKAAKVEGAFL